jgi:hypothetical protein
MPHAFSQSEYPFGQCEYFNQVDLFEKPWFLVVFIDVALSKIKFLNFGNS